MLPPEPAFARTSFPFDVTCRDIPGPLARGERTPTVGSTDDGLLLVVVCFVFMIVVLVTPFALPFLPPPQCGNVARDLPNYSAGVTSISSTTDIHRRSASWVAWPVIFPLVPPNINVGIFGIHLLPRPPTSKLCPR